MLQTLIVVLTPFWFADPPKFYNFVAIISINQTKQIEKLTPDPYKWIAMLIVSFGLYLL